MAKTGIKITTVDTVLGASNDVNKTSALIFDRRCVTPQGTRFKQDVLYKLTSVQGLEALGVTKENNPIVYEQVSDFYSPSQFIDNTGTVLWIGFVLEADMWDEGGASDSVYPSDLIVQSTAVSFDERPRQVGFVISYNFDGDAVCEDPDYVSYIVQRELAKLSNSYDIRAVGVVNYVCIIRELEDDSTNFLLQYPHAVTKEGGYPFVAVSIAGKNYLSTKVEGNNVVEPTIGLTLGFLSSVSVGTSIGDGGLPAMTTPLYLYIFTAGEGSSYPHCLACSSLSKTVCDSLGEKQYLFARTRPPRNGLWWNDGATVNDSDNALSTLEAARTICSMADDLQSFFVPYINSRVPVTSTGDIQPTYKQVVLDNARAAVVQKYIESGDISDARINLVAKDNDMIGTRTWEVTLSILPAPTLRWIDGYVFYVKSL